MRLTEQAMIIVTDMTNNNIQFNQTYSGLCYLAWLKVSHSLSLINNSLIIVNCTVYGIWPTTAIEATDLIE